MATQLSFHDQIETTSTMREIRRLYQQLKEEIQDNRIKITSPQDGAYVFMPELQNKEQEELWVMSLNTKGQVLSIAPIYRGSLYATQIRIGEIFRRAIQDNAASIIIAHNHPSGDPSPSQEDVAITKQIIEAGGLLGVEVLDHLIIGGGRYVSLAVQRLAFG